MALSELAAAAKASTLPPPDAKATYSEVMVTVGTFRTENMWYLAHPETGKKVTQQGVSVGRGVRKCGHCVFVGLQDAEQVISILSTVIPSLCFPLQCIAPALPRKDGTHALDDG